MMGDDAPAPDGPLAQPQDLSCYTANLALYLGRFHRDLPGVLSDIARTVRLAVRPADPQGSLGFSHHAAPLFELGGERRLEYRGTSSADELLAGLTTELDDHGQALLITYTGQMPWSLATPEAGAPHFLLVEGRASGRWRVRDAFSALSPAGQQDPYAGWIPAEELLLCATSGPRLRPEHHSRKELAFGFQVPLPPDNQFQWLGVSTRPRPAAAAAPMPPDWLVDRSAVLDYLRGFWSDVAQLTDRLRFIDDMWAAAQHHSFRYAHLIQHGRLGEPDRSAVAEAMAAWRNLPMALRFAADSAARNRPRPAMVQATFEQLRTADDRVQAVLADHDYLPSAAADGVLIAGVPAVSRFNHQGVNA